MNILCANYSACMIACPTRSTLFFICSADRNKGPILDVIKRHLPGDSSSSSAYSILELASGTGQHAEFIASAFPLSYFCPSDYVDLLFKSISVHCQNRPNVAPPK